MQKFILFASLFLFPFCSWSQKNKKNGEVIPDFGKVEKGDLEMKECDFDPKAEAVVLFDVGELSCLLSSNNVEINLTRRVRIKILSDKGKSQADIHLPYYSYRNNPGIGEISAQTYNLDGSGNIVTAKVDKKLIYDKRLNKRFSERVFTFPDVRPGSIIEFRYKLVDVGFMDWYFQRNIPVKYSQYTLDFPEEIEVHTTPKCSLPYDRDVENGNRTVETYIMKNVPALRDEPYILNEEDYMEKVESRPIAVNVAGIRTSLVTNWPKIIHELLEDEDFGLQLKKEIPRTDDLDAQLKKLSDPYDKMCAIHKYVRENMKWNGYTGIWALDGIKSAWKDKNGTVGEINLILLNLLKDAGLKAFPLLVSTHDNGLVNTTEAGYDQFNKVLAYVRIGEKVYILDATEKITPANLIPEDVILTEGLMIEKPDSYEWGWKTLWNEDAKSKVLLLMSGEIDSTGKLVGETKISSYDYARLDRIETARKGKKDFIEKFLTSSNPGLTIDSVSFENMDVDSLPLNQDIHFTEQLPSSGDYRYFTANFFTGLEKNPFLAENRVSDIFYGYTQSFNIIGTFYYPEGYVVEGLPKNIKMIMPDTSIVISRVSQADDVSIFINVSVEFKKPFYPNTQYAEFREFYKKLEDMLNEQFVIRKK